MQNGAIISDRGALRKNAGSKFTVSPTVAAFNQLVTQESGNIGVVATPCQALALAKMMLEKEDNPIIDQLKLVVGLYCGWTLSAEKYTKLLLEKIYWSGNNNKNGYSGGEKYSGAFHK